MEATKDDPGVKRALKRGVAALVRTSAATPHAGGGAMVVQDRGERTRAGRFVHETVKRLVPGLERYHFGR
jgi:hypothetical protein